MQKYFLLYTLITFFTSLCINAQVPQCGANTILPTKYKSIRNARQNLETIPDNSTIYTVPVVFVVYHLGEGEGVGNNISAAIINNTIENLNNCYRAKAGTNYSDGIDTKIQFTLAVRTPYCNTTNGIVRVNASSIPEYSAGASTYNNPALELALKALTPEYNGSTSNFGIVIRLVKNVAPWAGYATYFNDTFIGSNYLYASHLVPHELGHVLGLYHTFQGSFQDPATGQYNCPENNDPETDGDGIADTDPHKQNETNCGDPTLINACTNQPFGLLLKNAMSYANCIGQFTPNQISEMRYNLLNNMGDILNPKFLTTPSPSELLAPSVCTVTTGGVGVGNEYFNGIYSFNMNSIAVQSANYSYRNFYNDYSCIYKTTLIANNNVGFSLIGSFYTRLYIDYNDDGAYNETNELVYNSTTSSGQIFNVSNNSVKNKYLRCRAVTSEITGLSPCFLPYAATSGYGEIEDYAVMIVASSNCNAMETVQSGSFTDPAVWSCNRAPNSSDLLTIKANHFIYIDVDMVGVAKNLIIQGFLSVEPGGKLSLSN